MAVNRSIYYYMKVDLPRLWRHQAPPKFVPRFSLAKAHQMAEEKSAITLILIAVYLPLRASPNAFTTFAQLNCSRWF